MKKPIIKTICLLMSLCLLMSMSLSASVTAAALSDVMTDTDANEENRQILTSQNDLIPNLLPNGLRSDRVYRIRAVHAELYLTVSGGTDANLTNIDFESKSTNGYQLFKLDYDSTNDVYYIRAILSSNGKNRLVDVHSTSANPPANGKNVHLYAAGDYNSSVWKISNSEVPYDDLSTGLRYPTFYIKLNYNTNLSLTPAGGGTTSGTNASVATFSTSNNYQRFIFEEENNYNQPINDGVYRIKSKYDNTLYLNAAANSNLSNVTAATLATGNNQLFRIEYDYQNGVYYIRSMLSSYGTNRLLDVNSTNASPPANGRNVHLYTKDMDISCMWILEQSNDGSYRILLNYNTDLALTLRTSDNNVQVNTYKGTANQGWILEYQEYPIPSSITIAKSSTYSDFGLTGGSWSSSNTQVATVNSSGAVTGVNVGKAIITYTNGSTVYRCRVSVEECGDRSFYDFIGYPKIDYRCLSYACKTYELDAPNHSETVNSIFLDNNSITINGITGNYSFFWQKYLEGKLTKDQFLNALGQGVVSCYLTRYYTYAGLFDYSVRGDTYSQPTGASSVVMRITDPYILTYNPNSGTALDLDYDFHFWVLSDQGNWLNKHGMSTPLENEMTNIIIPENMEMTGWTIVDGLYYNSYCLYFYVPS